MSYENAPGTKLVATQCAMCGKDLLDAESVECGVGPVCRKRYRLAPKLTAEERAAANKLVHFIAYKQYDCEEVREAIRWLDDLGCRRIVDRISKRLYGDPIEVELVDDLLLVRSPYSGAFLDACRSVPSRRWNRAEKRTEFAASDWQVVEKALVDGYADTARVRVGGADEYAALKAGVLADLCASVTVKPAPPSPPTPVKIVRDAESGRVSIACPYEARVVDAMKDVQGRRWDGANRVNTFPLGEESRVMDIVRDAFDRVHVVEEEGTVEKKTYRGRRRRYY